MMPWVYNKELNAQFAAHRLQWQQERDWPIFRLSPADLPMHQWLRALRDKDLEDYCSLVPRLELGLHLEPEHRVRAEAIRDSLRNRPRVQRYRSAADKTIVEALRKALDDYFGHRGRRSHDGMLAYRRRLSDVDFQVQYRLSYGITLEIELAHSSVPRLLLNMILATPTAMRVGLYADIDASVKYVSAWLDEVAELVKFEPGVAIPRGK